MIKLRKSSDEVYYADEPIVRLGAAEVAWLKPRAAASPRRRARICAHTAPNDSLHEMLIVLAQGGYIRPHRHAAKAESFHTIEGEADVVIFDELGRVEEVIRMANRDGGALFYRLNAPRFHTVLVRSEFFVVHETTVGPFDPSATEYAPWSPAEGAAAEVALFLDRIDREVQARRRPD